MPATVAIVFHAAGNRSSEGGSMPVVRLSSSRAEVLTSGPASVATEGVSMAAISDNAGGAYVNRDGGFVTVTPVGGHVWIVAAPNPIAAVPPAGDEGAGFPVLDGRSMSFAVARGDKIAVIDWVA